MTEIMKITQLPVIEEQLQKVKAEVEKRTSEALQMVCTEDTRQAIKDIRADLNKEFKQYEELRTAIKKEVLKPYEQFESTYNDCIKILFKSCDEQLKSRIDEVESILKNDKENAIRTYFDELVQAENIDIITFEDIGLNITLSASLKSLKSQCKEYVEHIKSDLAMIDTQEFKEEIIVEYKRNGFCASQAILGVNNRHKAIEEEKARQTERETAEKARQEAIQKVEQVISAPVVEAVTAPIVKPVQEKTYQATFTVTATLEKIKLLKEFMNKEGIEYVGKQ